MFNVIGSNVLTYIVNMNINISLLPLQNDHGISVLISANHRNFPYKMFNVIDSALTIIVHGFKHISYPYNHYKITITIKLH